MDFNVVEGRSCPEDDVHLKKFQKELSAGTVSLALLAVLARAGEPLYGYLIAKELERVGEGVLSGKQSALYPVLRNLEGAGLLESHVEPSSSGPPRRYYRINERGREVLAQWRQAWQATPRFRRFRVGGGTTMNDPSLAGSALPTTIPQYLAQLRAALEGADPAMVQDALYDAEEYLRSELAAQPGRSETEVIADVAGSYGAPDEVAEIYRETEVTVNRALRSPRADTAPMLRAAAQASGVEPAAPPPTPVQRSLLARFFGVVADPHTYGALFYMLLSLATGIFFFTWVVTGLSLSLGLLILIIGIPLTVLFFGSVRGLALLEGRLVEALLGERMPRRPRYTDRSRTWLQRIGDMFTDGRTWLTLLYFVLMLPLGIIYFTIAVTLLSLSLSLIWAPVAAIFSGDIPGVYINDVNVLPMAASPLVAIAVAAVGALLLVLTLHLARGIGKLHGLIAKNLLVRL